MMIFFIVFIFKLYKHYSKMNNEQKLFILKPLNLLAFHSNICLVDDLESKLYSKFVSKFFISDQCCPSLSYLFNCLMIPVKAYVLQDFLEQILIDGSWIHYVQNPPMKFSLLFYSILLPWFSALNISHSGSWEILSVAESLRKAVDRDMGIKRTCST